MRFAANGNQTGVIRIGLKPDAHAAASESFKIQLYDARKGDVLGTLTTESQKVVNVTVDNHDNVVTGTAFADDIAGLAGNDRLSGSGGDDVLEGDSGRDTLLGGAGGDLFNYAALGDSTVSVMDTIGDFSQAGGDHIGLYSIDTNAKASGRQPFRFIGSSSFSGQAGDLRFQLDPTHNQTLIEGDANGDKKTDFAIKLTGGHIHLTASDFFL